MQKKLILFGHICRMPCDRLLKPVVFGTMEESNRRGRKQEEDGQTM